MCENKMLLFVSVTILSALTVSVTALPLAESESLNTPGRFRRKVGQLEVWSTAYDYMRKLLEDFADDQYRPKNYQSNPTSVFCFLDKDINNNITRTKPRNVEKCTSISQFVFDWETESYAHASLLPSGLLRPYMQVIPRHFRGEDTVQVDLSVTLRQFANNGTNEDGNSTVSSTQFLKRINTSIHSDGWQELDITDSLRAIWPPKKDTPFVEVILKMEVNCQSQRKVPVTFINPAEIPVTQVMRRERHEEFQPLLVVFVDDRIIKSQIRDEEKELKAQFNGSDIETVEISNSSSSGSSETPRQKRSIINDGLIETCKVESFTVNFTKLELYHIIEPTIMNIGRCSGACAHRNIKLDRTIATNHAKLMASTQERYSYNSSSMPVPVLAPSCVPTRYDNVYLLLKHFNNALQYSLFPDIVVKECGCR